MTALELIKFVPTGLMVEPPKQGIFIVVTLSYGAGYVESPVTIKIPLSEDGKKEAEFFIKIINETSKQMMEYYSESTEYIAKLVAKELNVDFKHTYEMINRFSYSDDSGDFALPIKYYMKFFDGSNQMISTQEVYLED